MRNIGNSIDSFKAQRTGENQMLSELLLEGLLEMLSDIRLVNFWYSREWHNISIPLVLGRSKVVLMCRHKVLF
jgi:hypothetical protein